MKNETAIAVNPGRHERCCKICSHKKREDIEQGFVAWKSPIAIAEEYRLADRMNVYRHANALGLFEKRRRNIRTALERITPAYVNEDFSQANNLAEKNPAKTQGTPGCAFQYEAFGFAR